MVLAMDAVRTGFVGSLAQPGGNITGLTAQATDIQGKALQLLKDAPTASRVAVLWDATEPGRRVQAPKRRVPPARWGWRRTCWRGAAPPNRIASSRRWLASGGRRPRDPSQMIGPTAPASQHSRHSTVCRPWASCRGGARPAVSCPTRARDLDLFQRAASYVDKIVQGTKAANLPVEQPMTFKLVINLQTAEALGLTVPPTVLFQGTR